MRPALFRLIALVTLIVMPWLAIRFSRSMLAANGDSAPAFRVLPFVLLCLPFLGLVVFELVSKRALGLAWVVIEREKSPAEYWFWVCTHGLMFVVAAFVAARFVAR